MSRLNWNRRTVLMTSSVGLVAAITAAALTVLRTSVPATLTPTSARSSGAVLAGPLVSGDHQALTQLVQTKAVLVDPAGMRAAERRTLQHAMHQPLGTAPLLWLAGPQAVRRWSQHPLPGVRVVRARVWQAKEPSADGLLMVAARQAGDLSTGPWTLKQGLWEVSSRAARITTLNAHYTLALAAMVQGGGTAWVLGPDGAIEAGVAKRPGDLFQAQPVGLAALPPLMGEAMANPQAKAALAQSSSSLDSMASAWGASSIKRAISRLGFAQAYIGADAVAVPGLPPSITAATVSSGVGLRATGLQVARAYVPFIDRGRLPGVFLLAETTPPRGVRVLEASAADGVWSSLPEIREHGVRFRVWRPAGNYAVVVSRQLHLVLVLTGAAVDKTMAAAAAVAQHP